MKFSEHPIEWDDAKVSRLWDYYSRTPPYSEIYFSKVVGDRVLTESELPSQPLDVVDFGCGPGFMWEHIRRMRPAWRYVGLDFSPESVRKVIEKGAGNPQFGGAHHLASLPSTLPSSHADVVMLIEVVEHLRDEHLRGTLTEAARLLKPGGVLLITTPNEEDLNKATRFCPECGSIFHEWQHLRSWSVRSLSQAVEPFHLQLQRSKTLDLTARNLTRKLVGLGRRVLHGPRPAPHMLALFQKPVVR